MKKKVAPLKNKKMPKAKEEVKIPQKKVAPKKKKR